MEIIIIRKKLISMEGCPGTVREVEINTIRKKLISMSIICASLTVQTQPSLRFHVEASLSFRNSEMDYL